MLSLPLPKQSKSDAGKVVMKRRAGADQTVSAIPKRSKPNDKNLTNGSSKWGPNDLASPELKINSNLIGSMPYRPPASTAEALVGSQSGQPFGNQQFGSQSFGGQQLGGQSIGGQQFGGQSFGGQQFGGQSFGQHFQQFFEFYQVFRQATLPPCSQPQNQSNW